MSATCKQPGRPLDSHISRLLLAHLLIVTFALCLVAGLAGCRKSDAASGTDLELTDLEMSHVDQATPYLDLALQAERWVAAGRIETPAGVEWRDLPRDETLPHVNTPDDPANPDEGGPTIDLYHGGPGVILFYLELAAATGNQDYLYEAQRGANQLIARLADTEDPSMSLYSGIGGAVFALDQIRLATGEEQYAIAARNLLDRIRKAATEVGDGIAWFEPMPFSDIHGQTGTKEVLDMTHGAAGIGLLFLYAHDSGLHDDALDWATAAGDRLLETAIEREGGLEWQMVVDPPIDFTAPNFSHGTAGVAYFLARLNEATGEQRFLDAALAGAGRLTAIATVDGDSRLIYHHEGDGAALYYLSWCHGPAGTGRLFHQLAKLTGDDRWNQWMVGGGDGILAMGAPHKRTAGFWNNVSQCCGDAGIGEYALNLYQATGKQRFLDLAKEVAGSLEARGEAAASGICWLQAEHRSRPDYLKAHTGYMQGAAGIGSFFLRLHGVLEGESHKIHLPDSPFGSIDAGRLPVDLVPTDSAL